MDRKQLLADFLVTFLAVFLALSLFAFLHKPPKMHHHFDFPPPPNMHHGQMQSPSPGMMERHHGPMAPRPDGKPMPPKK